jgi:hypothetical protein
VIPSFLASVVVNDAAMNEEMKEAIALFRFGVLGPLVSARLERGDRRAFFEAAAARRHVLPDGTETRISARTIETWFYAHKKGGLRALRPQSRSDEGKSRAIGDNIEDLIRREAREAAALGHAHHQDDRARRFRSEGRAQALERASRARRSGNLVEARARPER